MKKSIVNIYTFLYSKNRRRVMDGGKNRILGFLLLVCYKVVGATLYLWLLMENAVGKRVEPLRGRDGVIVSLTTYPARIKTVWMTIDSIFEQKVKPAVVKLYLSREEFPFEMIGLPKALLRYVGKGLEIHFVEKNIMPHKKYLYAFREVLDSGSDDVVITVDDDLYYRNDMIDHLLQLHEMFPDCVCGNTLNRMEPGVVHPKEIIEPTPYKPTHSYVAVGYGGVLYPVRLFEDKRMFDTSLIAKYCIRADDMWLKAFELLNDIHVVTGDFYMPHVEIPNTQELALYKTNCDSSSPVTSQSQWDNLNMLFGVNALVESVDLPHNRKLS